MQPQLPNLVPLFALAKHLGADRSRSMTGMRLGEASGAAVAAGVEKSALACHNGMPTFEGAGVSNKE